MSKKIVPTLVKKATKALIKSGKRSDGRAFDEMRPVKIIVGEYGQAEGSATVWLGKTMVAGGIKIGETEPYPDSPDVGVLSSNAELVPAADPQFQAGPPSEEAIELARVVDRGIRESKCIELEKLCIEPGVKTRAVFIDSYVMDNDGNYMDASSIAAITALHNAVVPDFGPLPISKKPIANTFIKVGSDILLDPTLEEEHVADARLTITIEDNNMVCAMQKANSGSWTEEEVSKCIDIAIKRATETRQKVEAALAAVKTTNDN
ncbi:MAG: exosome complex protein Rrp42 [Candidatus Undinarchaeales archaeon]|jgi:exosome complex component RRP42|nr:exosome complex protein Rrp42 [Candidatus Undinarchaeales archaeon]